MTDKKVLLAFSGGIDSCAAVEILRKDGYEVEGMTIDMIDDKIMVQKARENADRLNIKLHVINGVDIFKREIIDNFTSEYLEGRTPAPCTRCNTLIKWELLIEVADKLGIKYIATGHYFRVTKHNGHYYVTRGVDPKKDQSYYLWGVREEILKRTLTPLGDQIKEDIKSRSTEKRESMGVCFLKGEHYTDFLYNNLDEIAQGEVVNTNGDVVGTHNGVARYTIGQRRGQGIPNGMRVIGVDAKYNRIIIGENDLLFRNTLILYNCNIADTEEVESSKEIKVMIRGIGLNPEDYASVHFLYEYSDDDLIAQVELSNPAWAAAPGQPVVLYIGDRVVGGGYLMTSM